MSATFLLLFLCLGVSLASVAVQDPHCPCVCGGWGALNTSLNAAITVQENRLRNILYSGTFYLQNNITSANATVGLQAPLKATFKFIRVDDIVHVLVKSENGTAVVAATGAFIEYNFPFPTHGDAKCDGCINIPAQTGSNVTYLMGHVMVTGLTSGTVVAKPVYDHVANTLRFILPTPAASGTAPPFQLGGTVSSNNIGAAISISSGWLQFYTDVPFSTAT